MLLLHNTILLICFFIEKTIPPLQEFWRIYPADAWSHSAAAESCPQLGTLFRRREILFCGRRIPFCWLLLVLNHISRESWNCLFEYTWKWFFWRILLGDPISGYASFWHLEAPFWSLQNFFCPQQSQFSFFDKWYICSVYTIYFIN
jgi:hypothetical protein